MKVENIMLNVRSQSEKATDCMISFILHVQNTQTCGVRKYGCQGPRGRGTWTVTPNRYEVSFRDDKNILN